METVSSVDPKVTTSPSNDVITASQIVSTIVLTFAQPKRHRAVDANAIQKRPVRTTDVDEERLPVTQLDLKFGGLRCCQYDLAVSDLGVRG